MAKKEKLIFFIGRENWQKDDDLHNILVTHLRKKGLAVLWDDPAGNWTYKLRQFESRNFWIPKWIRKFNFLVVKIVYALFHWHYWYYIIINKTGNSDWKIRMLKNRMQQLSYHYNIFIISRSAGGRITSKLADEIQLQYIICMGYPFKHPNMPEELDRFQHLETLKTPMLILQGDMDEYGGFDVVNKYKFSNAVELMFVNANHDFKLSNTDWHAVLLKIDSILKT